jgi:hypothetical protein
MPMFVDPNARVPVTLGENTIYVKAKMDMGTRALLEDEIRTNGKTVDEAELRGAGAQHRGLGGPGLCRRAGAQGALLA